MEGHRYLLLSGSARNIRTVMQAEIVGESPHFITEEEYLEGELHSEVRHECLDGCVFAMAGASAAHLEKQLSIRI